METALDTPLEIIFSHMYHLDPHRPFTSSILTACAPLKTLTNVPYLGPSLFTITTRMPHEHTIYILNLLHERG